MQLKVQFFSLLVLLFVHKILIAFLKYIDILRLNLGRKVF